MTTYLKNTIYYYTRYRESALAGPQHHTNLSRAARGKRRILQRRAQDGGYRGMRGGAYIFQRVRVPYPRSFPSLHRTARDKQLALKNLASPLKLDSHRSSLMRTPSPCLRLVAILTFHLVLPSSYRIWPSPRSHSRRLDEEKRKVEGPLIDLMVVFRTRNAKRKKKKNLSLFFFFPQPYTY